MKFGLPIFGVFKSSSKALTTPNAATPVVEAKPFLETLVAKVAAQATAELPTTKWAELRSTFPETYSVLQRIMTTCPDLIATVVDKPQYTSGDTPIRIFSIAVQGCETDELRHARLEANQNVIFPLTVRIDLARQKIIGAANGSSGAGFSDVQSAELIVEKALHDNIVAFSTHTEGLDGKPLAVICPGPLRAFSKPKLTVVPS